MSDKKGWVPRICGNCGRIAGKNRSRNYCPVTAQSVQPNKSAAACIFYMRSEGSIKSARDEKRRRRDVFEE